MPKITWTFELEDGQHTAELDHGYFSGKRIILLDGEIVEHTRRLRHLLFDSGSNHVFQINDHSCQISILVRGIEPYYYLAVDDLPIEPTDISSPVDLVSFLRWIVTLPLVVGILALAILESLRGPGNGLLDAVPPALRCLVTPVIIILVMFGSTGLILVILLDICRSFRMKQIGRWILFFLSVALCVLTALFWAKNEQEYIGLVHMFRLGYPLWPVAVPGLCLFSMIALAWNPRGVYVALVLVSAVLLLLSASSLEVQPALVDAVTLQDGPGAYLSLPLCLGILLLAIGMSYHAHQEGTPLDAWHARVIYLGTYRHYLELGQLARQNEWQILGPSKETGFAVMVHGVKNGKAVHITSNSQHLAFSVASEEPLYPIHLVVVGQDSRPVPASTATMGEYLDARGRRRTFYLYPPEDEIIDSSTLATIEKALKRGQPFLRSLTEVWSEDRELWFYRPKGARAREGTKEIEAMLDWMVQVCQATEIEEGQPGIPGGST